MNDNFVDIKVEFTTVMVEKYISTIRVPANEAWRYKGESPCLSGDAINQMLDNYESRKDIRLHHSHYKKLQKSGLCGWFDFKFGKPKKRK